MTVTAPSFCCAGVVFGVIALSGCAEPSFVSLGRNLTLVRAEDAGAILSPTNSPSDAASLEEPMTAPAALVEPPFIDPCEVAGRNLVMTGCEAREKVQCPAPTVQVPDPLDATLSNLLLGCEAYSVAIVVRFELGCATSYDLSSQVLPEVAACIGEHLTSERYDCAESVVCGTGQYFLPLTN